MKWKEEFSQQMDHVKIVLLGAGALVWWLWEKTHILKFMGLSPSTVN